MTSNPKVSVIIVSRHRPVELRRLLVSLQFLRYPVFEVVVVADANPVSLFPDLNGVSDIKYVPFDTPNISAARNLGLRFSAGDIVAFCDDDAVPEPTWLDALIAPFENPEVAAAGGYVLGRNGISFQWKASTFDRYANAAPLDLPSEETVILTGDQTTGIKTEGTNAAFRTKPLRNIGGFDENYRYFLDETDVDYRLGLAGWKTAIVPGAQVHHAFAANDVRTHGRVPIDLMQIGASKAYFCKRHGEPTKVSQELQSFRRAQRRRLVSSMVAGKIEPFSVDELMATLERGIEDGLERKKTSTKAAMRARQARFKPYMAHRKQTDGVALASRVLSARRFKAHAKTLADSGVCVTLFRLSLTARFHKTCFKTDGYWMQSGGIFGKSVRTQRLFQRGSLTSRVKQEMDRVKHVRPMKLATKQ